MSEDQVEVVRTMLNAFNRDDVEAGRIVRQGQMIEPFEMPDRPALGFRGHQGIRERMAEPRGPQAPSSIPGLHRAGDLLLREITRVGRPGQRRASRRTTFAVIESVTGRSSRCAYSWTETKPSKPPACGRGGERLCFSSKAAAARTRPEREPGSTEPKAP